MSNKDANKENEGGALSAASINPSLHKNVIVFATDMTEEMRGSIIAIAQRAFNAPVNHHGKVYQTIADSIRSEFEQEYDAIVAGSSSSSGGGSGMTRGQIMILFIIIMITIVSMRTMCTTLHLLRYG